MTTIPLADHSLLLAIPAFGPALLVVGVVVWVATKDRRAAAAEARDDDRAAADEDGAP